MRAHYLSTAIKFVGVLLCASTLTSCSSNSVLPSPTDLTAPAMGFNPYNQFGNDFGAADVEQVAAAMARNGMKDAGYSYVNIDDSWQGERDSNGNLTANAQFPQGIKPVADYVHSLGLKIGIYTTPAATSCGGHTGSKGHTVQDARTFASWGIDYVKLDWCGATTSTSGASDIARSWNTALRSTGRPIVLSINAGSSSGVARWAARSVNSWRAGPDICASWYNKIRAAASNAIGCYDNTNYDGIYDYLYSDISASAPYVRSGRFADTDMLEVGNDGLSTDEAKTEFSLWAMWSSPLIAGNDPRTITATDATSSILLNREVIAVDQDQSATIAVKLEDVAGLQLWTRTLADGTKAVAMVNAATDDLPHEMSFTASDVHAPAMASLRDLWAHMDIKVDNNRYSTTVPSHGIALLRTQTTS